ncbi:MAG TPA: choice-of-anchor Q domain-containing protein, partial [Ferruginibacter sp.]|nr:choice-of-anchor Q domain-containing protein [Ferruginibacter sp.]
MHQNYTSTFAFFLRRILTILLCFLITYSAFSQPFFYVKPSGSDANNGGSWTTAFESIQKALVVATPGSKILVAAGVYFPDEGFNAVDNVRSSTFTLKNQVSMYGGFEPEFGIDDLNDTRVQRSRLSGDLLQNDGVGGPNIIDNAFHVVTAPPGINSSTVLDGFTITEGNANGGGINNNGGGMYNDGAGPSISNCSFFANSASTGGGIYNLNGSPLIFNCSFTQNKSLSRGGGILNDHGIATITSCVFYNNSGGSQGGGIYNAGSGSIITNCEFTANTASYGAGLYNDNSAANIINCTIYGNNSVSGGGGIYNETAFADPAAPPKIFNCIIWGNSTTINNSATVPEVSHSIVQGGYAGTNNKDLDPLFVNAANGNLHLQQCSPAINAGLNSANTTTKDLDGNARIFSSTIDMGAYESQTTACCPAGNVLYVKKDATGDNNGMSWPDAFTRLQDALAKTNLCANVTQIWVAKGTYYPDEGGNKDNNDRQASFVMKNNLAIYGGFDGSETQLNQRDWINNVTILSGDIDQNDEANFVNINGNSYHVILNDGNDLDNTSIIDGFTISGGNAYDAPQRNGGGMLNELSSPYIINCIFQSNKALDGGGIYNELSSEVKVENCTFSGNRAENAGGAIYNKESILKGKACAFIVNTAFQISRSEFDEGNGSAIFNDESSMEMINSIFSRHQGEAITNISSGVTLTNCSFSGNSTDVFNRQSPFQATNCIFTRQIVVNNGASQIPYPNLVTYSNVSFPGTGNINTNPQYENPANDNLSLKSISPAINAGLNSANTTTTDLAGNARIFNGIIDMGAYESQATGSCPSGNVFYVNKDAIGDNNGMSWPDAFTSLQDALAKTSQCANVTQIWVAKGTYYPDEGLGKTNNDRNASFVMKNNLAIYGGFAGGETLLSERAWITNETILSGDIDQNDAADFINYEGNSFHIIFNLNNGLNNTAALD